MFCVLVLSSKTLLVLTLLALAACADEAGEWQAVPLEIPGVEPEVVYLRQSMPNFVGTEQYRRLQVGAEVLKLPVQSWGRGPVNIYLTRDPSDARLYFSEGACGAVVYLGSSEVSEECASVDTMGTFVGSLRSPEIHDLHFTPASSGPPVEFDR